MFHLEQMSLTAILQHQLLVKAVEFMLLLDIRIVGNMVAVSMTVKRLTEYRQTIRVALLLKQLQN